MKTPTIEAIKEKREVLIESIDKYRKIMKEQDGIDLNTPQFGEENEYSINGLIAGCRNILTDVSYLTRSHAYFIKVSTKTERDTIKTHLINLENHFKDKEHKLIASSIDALKVTLRAYNLRLDKDRFLDFSNEIDNLRRKATLLDEEIDAVKKRIEDGENIHTEILATKTQIETTLNSINDNKDNLLVKIEEFENKYNDLSDLAESAVTNTNSITTKLKSATEDKLVFDEFIEKIDTREVLFTKQDETFSKYEDKLQEYKREQTDVLNKAKDLIEKSKIALGYTTAEGLSTAFSEKHSESKHWGNTIGWLIGAGVFIISTLLLGIWILTGWGMEPNTDTIVKIVGRLSLIPFTLLAALFCANQYIKQKNIIEDYAYKSVLAKSMIAFSEELRVNDNERYAEYISTVLKEIHQDPLRRRDKEKKEELNLNDSISTLSKIIELIKPIISNNKL